MTRASPILYGLQVLKLVWTLDSGGSRPIAYPRDLTAARRSLRAGTLAYSRYRAIEDRIATDLPCDIRCFLAGTEGLAQRSPGSAFVVVDKLTALQCPAVDEFAYVSGCTELDLQVTLPAPEAILGFWCEQARTIYPNPLELVQDASEVVKTWIGELADAGCRHIEVGAPQPDTGITVAGLISPLWTTQKARS